MKQKNSYLLENGRFVKATKWKLFKSELKSQLKRWKLVDKYSNRIVPSSDWERHFVLTPKELEDAKNIYKEKGAISYEFYPCAGIAWGVRVRVLKTGEVIDISDVDSW